jgi:glucan phosphoethanolaminetransferase (alkaline phosphatase superfamily)
MSYGKSPWIAAFLNFVIWGSGYLYIKHRMVLGAGLVLVMLFNFMILIAIPKVIILSSSELFFIWLSFIWAALSVLFAVDVYRETRELNKI